MSLQGSIETFAVADVLRLLAATSKSGRLHVQGPTRAGTLWVDRARILAADSASTPHASGPIDIVFQLLRFDRGSFRFELDRKPAGVGEPVDIEYALGEAEAMLQEWRELEPRITSPEAWVHLRPSIDAAAVTLSAAEWATVVAVSGGCTIARLGDSLRLGELQTAKLVARLLDLELAGIGTAPETAAAADAPIVVQAPAPVEEPVAPAVVRPSVAEPDAGSVAAVSVEDVVVVAVPEPVEEVVAAAPVMIPEPPSAGMLEAGTVEAGMVEMTAPEAPVEPSAIEPVADRTWSIPAAPPAPQVVESWSAAAVVAPEPAAPEPAAPAPTVADVAPFEPAVAAVARPEGGPLAPPVDADETVARTVFEVADPGLYAYPQSAEPELYTYPPTTAEPARPEPVAGSDAGYPAVPPPMPPRYAAVVPEPAAPAVPVGQGDDNGWIGSLAEAIEQSDLGGASVEPAQPVAWAPVAVPPPPPAPTAPVGSWPTPPTSLFKNGGPERLAPPPPPPPPPGAEPVFAAAPAAPAPAPVPGEGAEPTVILSDDPGAAQDDLERQLFNLSPRAREAVKQSTGLRHGRGND